METQLIPTLTQRVNIAHFMLQVRAVMNHGVQSHCVRRKVEPQSGYQNGTKKNGPVILASTP